jgi:hypothetical protein
MQHEPVLSSSKIWTLWMHGSRPPGLEATELFTALLLCNLEGLASLMVSMPRAVSIPDYREESSIQLKRSTFRHPTKPFDIRAKNSTLPYSAIYGASGCAFGASGCLPKCSLFVRASWRPRRYNSVYALGKIKAYVSAT